MDWLFIPSGVMFPRASWLPDGSGFILAGGDAQAASTCPNGEKPGALFRFGLDSQLTKLSTIGCGSITDVDISHSGDRVVFTINGDLGDSRIATASLDGTAVSIVATAGPNEIFLRPTWALDDQSFAVVVQDQIAPSTLERIAVLTGGRSTLVDASPRWVVGAAHGGIYPEPRMADVVAPVVTLAVDVSRWFTSPASVSWTAVDDVDGPLPSPPPVTVSTDGAGQAVTSAPVCDAAGNCASGSASVDVDQTAPTVVSAVVPAANAAGWDKLLVTLTASCADQTSGVASCSGPMTVSTEGSNQARSLIAVDVAGNSSSATVSGINIDLTAPTVSAPTFSPSPVGSTTPVSVSAADSLSGELAVRFSFGSYPGVGSAISPMTLAGTTLSASVGASIVPGVYPVGVRSMDVAGNWSATAGLFWWSMTPAAGSLPVVVGSNSPAGSYVANPTLEGRANFGFESRYKQGQSVPDGNTVFQFQAGDLKFKSTSYEWLIVAGARAQFKGTGTINGSGSYNFLLTAIDGQIDPVVVESTSSASRSLAQAVWYTTTTWAANDSSAPSTALGGGSIVIHN